MVKEQAGTMRWERPWTPREGRAACVEQGAYEMKFEGMLYGNKCKVAVFFFFWFVVLFLFLQEVRSQLFFLGEEISH